MESVIVENPSWDYIPPDLVDLYITNTYVCFVFLSADPLVGVTIPLISIGYLQNSTIQKTELSSKF